MRKIYLLFLCVFILVLPACDSDDSDTMTPTPIPTPGPSPVPSLDTTVPQIVISSPQSNTTYLAIGMVGLRAWVKDDKVLKEMRLFVREPSGSLKRLDITDYGMVDDGTGEYIIETIKPGGTVSGTFTILIEAEDLAKNVAKDSVRINILAEELSKIDFKTAFTSTGWFEYSDGDEYGLDQVDFVFAFNSILNKYAWDYYIDPAYVNEFGEDFGGHSQLWDTWDTNNNDNLEYSEFEKGFDNLKFFDNWDINNNGYVSKNELTDGVGDLWDVNNYNVVTAAEFEQKLRKYFLVD